MTGSIRQVEGTGQGARQECFEAVSLVRFILRQGGIPGDLPTERPIGNIAMMEVQHAIKTRFLACIETEYELSLIPLFRLLDDLVGRLLTLAEGVSQEIVRLRTYSPPEQARPVPLKAPMNGGLAPAAADATRTTARKGPRKPFLTVGTLPSLSTFRSLPDSNPVYLRSRRPLRHCIGMRWWRW